MNRAVFCRVRVVAPVPGAWVGALDAEGRWVSLTPEAFAPASTAPWADAPVAARAQAQFERWCATGEAPPVAAAGTVFRRRVWAAVAAIPRGESRTYAAIAREVGCASARAVGGAVGANPVGLFIPCHRVCGAGGALTGYAWGLDLKRRILDMETRQPGA